MERKSIQQRLQERFPLWPWAVIKARTRDGMEVSIKLENLVGADSWKQQWKRLKFEGPEGKQYKLDLWYFGRGTRRYLRRIAKKFNNQNGLIQLILRLREEAAKKDPNWEEAFKEILNIPKQGKRGVEPSESTIARLEWRRLAEIEQGEKIRWSNDLYA